MSFAPMRQADLRDSTGYALNTVKTALQSLIANGMVERRLQANSKRYELALSASPLARDYRDLFLRDFDRGSAHKIRRSPVDVLDTVDALRSTLGIIRRSRK